MKISSIKQQVKRADRYSVYIDGKYSFSLSQVQLADSGLHTGQELTNNDIEKLKGQSDFGKLWDRTLKWLAIRPRSQWEIDSYLKRKTKSEALTQGVVQKLSALKLIDDKKFAQSWVESRRLLKSRSRQRLRQELLQKRVAKDIVDQVLEADETDETEVLKELISRKARQSQYGDRQKLMAYLSRQGWRYDQIKTALDELEI